MKTNFFEQIAGLQINGNLLLNIHHDTTGIITVSAVLKKGNVTATSGNSLPPMLFKGTATELNEGFFEQFAQPVKQTIGIINNLEAYQKELEKAKKNGRNDKDKAGKTTAATSRKMKRTMNRICSAHPPTMPKPKPKKNACLTKQWTNPKNWPSK